jgi:peptidyl-prolyl cis-trans isomerase D
MFASEKGFIYGPYTENQSMVLAKLIDKKNLPDSVHARHILIQPNESRSPEVVKALADSLKNLLENKADFRELAMRFSDDKGSVAEGGDLKWFSRGAMVKPFEDSCFIAKVNEIKLVETQYGIHIIQVLEKSKETEHVKVGFIERVIEPSQETRQQVFALATDFVSKVKNFEEFKTVSGEKALVKRTANNLTPTESKIAGLDSPREIIRWAYNTAEKNQVSDIFELNNKFVVAVLTEVREKGIATLDQVKEDIILNVRKNKKADSFIAEFNKYPGVKIDELSAKVSEPANEGMNITFNSFSLPNVGIEPEIIAAMSVSAKGFISKPMKGNNGVFVYEITNVIPSDQKDFSQDKIRVANDLKTRVEYQTFEALKKYSEITDKRVKFM